MNIQSRDIDFSKLYIIGNSRVKSTEEMQISFDVQININDATKYTYELSKYCENNELDVITLKSYYKSYSFLQSLINKTFADLVNTSLGNSKVVGLYSSFSEQVDRFIEQISFYLDIVSAKKEIEAGNTIELDEAFEI